MENKIENITKDKFDEIIDNAASFESGITIDTILELFKLPQNRANYLFVELYFEKKIKFKVLQFFLE